MVDIAKNEATKSLSWLAIDKVNQEKIITLCKKHLKTEDKSEILGETKWKDEYYSLIGELLGVQSKLTTADMRRLREWAEYNKGGVFDRIIEHVKKFDEIEGAAMFLAKGTKNIKLSCPFL